MKTHTTIFNNRYCKSLQSKMFCNEKQLSVRSEKTSVIDKWQNTTVSHTELVWNIIAIQESSEMEKNDGVHLALKTFKWKTRISRGRAGAARSSHHKSLNFIGFESNISWENQDKRQFREGNSLLPAHSCTLAAYFSSAIWNYIRRGCHFWVDHPNSSWNACGGNVPMVESLTVLMFHQLVFLRLSSKWALGCLKRSSDRRWIYILRDLLRRLQGVTHVPQTSNHKSLLCLTTGCACGTQISDLKEWACHALRHNRQLWKPPQTTINAARVSVSCLYMRTSLFYGTVVWTCEATFNNNRPKIKRLKPNAPSSSIVRKQQTYRR